MATLSAHRKHKVTIVGSGNWYVVHQFGPNGSSQPSAIGSLQALN
jgi:hypothetical protein